MEFDKMIFPQIAQWIEKDPEGRSVIIIALEEKIDGRRQIRRNFIGEAYNLIYSIEKSLHDDDAIYELFSKGIRQAVRNNHRLEKEQDKHGFYFSMDD